MNPARAVGLLVWSVGVACTGRPERAPDAPPDLLVVAVGDGWSPTPGDGFAAMAWFPQSQSIHTDPAASLRALLTGQWPGTASQSVPNTLHGVLKLYGYRTVGRVPARLTRPDAPWLTRGLDAAPFGSHGCLAELLPTVSSLWPGPSDKAVATVLVVDDTACDPAAEQQALRAALSAPEAAHRVTMVVGLGGGDWRTEAGAPAPVYLAGPGLSGGAHDGFASVVDVVPTLLPLAGAVVPSDAIGASLLRADAPPAGAELVFQQGAEGLVGIRTRKHLIYVEGGPGPLPEEPPSTLHYLPLAGHTDTLDTVRAPLYGALLQWDRQRRATSAAERMGSGAFREMLRDQGYWH